MEQLSLKIEPYANDPGHWGASLVNVAEVMIPCLDVVSARSIVEVGAYAGDLTGLLLQWAKGANAQVTAVDPFPQEELVQLERGELGARAGSRDQPRRAQAHPSR